MFNRRRTDAIIEDRRSFLRYSGGCAALSSTSLLSTLVNLKLTNTAIANQSGLTGYKSVVCLFLLGGYDSFNMLAPYETGEYADYSRARSNLAIPRDQLLPVTSSSGRRFGVHPGMGEVKQLYDDGKLAFVANVGSLIEPITKQTYESKRKPLGLFSHSDLIQHWQTAVPQSRSQVTGWAGRMADMLTDSSNLNPNIAMNISLGGLNILETGNSVVPYVVQSSGATTLGGYGSTGSGQYGMYTRFTDNMLSETYGNLLEKSYAEIRKQSIEAALEFNAAVNAVTINTVFPDTSLGDQLKMIAKSIGARGTLQHSRQTYFVSRGGWDHHDEVLNAQAAMLPEVSQCLKAFYDALVELGVQNDVVAFTASDFGRTLSSNGNGSDHAWGGNHIVVGGAVKGGDVYGEYPLSLAPNNAVDLGRGRLIPTTSVDEYAAELAMWFGLQNNADLENALPNIRNFYSSGASKLPVGFLASSGSGSAAPEASPGPQSRPPKLGGYRPKSPQPSAPSTKYSGPNGGAPSSSSSPNVSPPDYGSSGPRDLQPSTRFPKQ